jgi:hypothetical protein
VQKFRLNTGSELPRALILSRLRAAVHRQRGGGSEQKGNSRSSIWHLVRISLTIDERGFKNEVYFAT